MRYYLINIDTEDDSQLNRLFQIYILKDAAYNSVKKDNLNRQLNYQYILVRGYEYRPGNEEEIALLNRSLNIHYDIQDDRTNCYNLSVGRFIKNGLRGSYDFEKFCSSFKFRISFIQELDDSMFSVSYTDGSVKKDTKRAGWATVKVGEPSEDGLFDIFSCRNCSHDDYAGYIDNGTNNIGELNGIKAATENLSDKLYQVIISDSDYGMKSFRGYIHNWRQNGYKGADKKPIKNLELIQSIDKNIIMSRKIFLFQWTESHVGTPFNELCDVLAKQQSGVL